MRCAQEEKEKPKEHFRVRKDSLRLTWKWTEKVVKGDILILLHETNRQLESQRVELYHASQWAGQAQMENSRILEGLTMKSRIYQESHVREIAKKLVNHEEFAVSKRVRQLGIDEISLQKKKENPSTVNQFLSQGIF